MNFQFDEEKHLYTLDGRRLISVTEALSVLDDRWKVDPFYLERGRFIHKATELYDKNELDESTVDERIKPYLDAYKKFKRETSYEPIYIEHILYHPKYFYAGKLDRIYEDFIIDLKSGTKMRVDELQAVAYWELCRANNIPVQKQFDLYLRSNGSYRLEPVERPRNLLPVFLAAFTCERWRQEI